MKAQTLRLIAFAAMFWLLCLALMVVVNGCGTEDAIANPLSTAPLSASSTEFVYTHTGCPVDLLVWDWVGGIAQPPQAFLNLSESLRLNLTGERVTWRLRVDNGEPLGFTVDGEGDCTLTQPGCF